jgi:hypothetical protein
VRALLSETVIGQAAEERECQCAWLVLPGDVRSLDALIEDSRGKPTPEHHGMDVAGERCQRAQHRPWLGVEQ